jgi:hypothetical protein
MKFRIFSILVAALLLLGVGQPALAQENPPGDPETAVVLQTFLYPDGQRPAELEQFVHPLAGSASDIAVQGSGWIAEQRTYFAAFVPKAWGVDTRAKNAVDTWVHLAIPIPSFLSDVAQKITYVEFCARARNPLVSRPIRMDLWANGSRFSTTNITWPNLDTVQCYGVSMTAVWKEALGISVLVRYANAVDIVTMYKGWASVRP